MTDIRALVELARAAGERIMDVYDGRIEVTHKADASPLTEADLASHDTIVAGLQALAPDVPIISEEGSIPPHAQRAGWTRFWLVDPLDGTKEFIKRNGEFTVNIALIEDGVPTVGVIHAPARALSYFATRERGAWRIAGDGPPVRIRSRPARPEDALVVVSSRSHGSDELAAYLAQYRVKSHVFAGSSLKFCLVAEGAADIYPRFGPTMEWDVAAGDCIYRHSAEAGAHESALRYNKPELRNAGFVIGF